MFPQAPFRFWSPLALALFLFALGTARAVAPPPGRGGDAQTIVTVTDRHDKGAVSVTKGGQVVVRLVATPSTGYTWQVAALDKDLLELAGKPAYERAAASRGQVGARLSSVRVSNDGAGHVRAAFALRSAF